MKERSKKIHDVRRTLALIEANRSNNEPPAVKRANPHSAQLYHVAGLELILVMEDYTIPLAALVSEGCVQDRAAVEAYSLGRIELLYSSFLFRP